MGEPATLQSVKQYLLESIMHQPDMAQSLANAYSILGQSERDDVYFQVQMGQQPATAAAEQQSQVQENL